MSDPDTNDGVRDGLAARGEEALGKLAQDLLENPIVNGALTRALGVRDKAAQAQEVAMGALNIPSASDLERLTRRLRSVSQRLEGIEDGLDRIEQSGRRRPDPAADLAPRLAAIEERLAALSAQVEDLGDAPRPVPHAQERLQVDSSSAPAGKPRAASASKSRAASGSKSRAAAKPPKTARSTPKS